MKQWPIETHAFERPSKRTPMWRGLYNYVSQGQGLEARAFEVYWLFHRGARGRASMMQDSTAGVLLRPQGEVAAECFLSCFVRHAMHARFRDGGL